MAYPFHLYFGQGGLWYHTSDLSVTTSPSTRELQCCSRAPWCSAECLRDWNKRYQISLKKICYLRHWQGLGKCSWCSDFTWNLPFKLTGLVNNVLRKRLKMWALFPLSLVFWLTLVIFFWAYFFVISLPLKHEWWCYIHYLVKPVY